MHSVLESSLKSALYNLFFYLQNNCGTDLLRRENRGSSLPESNHRPCPRVDSSFGVLACWIPDWRKFHSEYSSRGSAGPSHSGYKPFTKGSTDVRKVNLETLRGSRQETGPRPSADPTSFCKVDPASVQGAGEAREPQAVMLL